MAPGFVGPLPTPAGIIELDFGTLAKVAGNMPELAVVRPLSLTLAKPPALTLDAWGYIAVYLGRSGKSAEVNKSTSLFRPINSEYPVNVDRAQVAAALARVAEAEQSIFTTILGEDRKPDEGVVVLLDTSYSMRNTGFAAGKNEDEGDEEEDDDGSSESDGDDEDEEVQGLRDLDADVKYGLPALPHPGEILCPYELQCPLTKGILLDPVIASDGQVYERQAIRSYIHNQQYGTHLRYQPGPFRSPVGRGATAIRPEVELRADEETQRRVVAYLRDVYPGYALPPPSGEVVGLAATTAAAAPALASEGAEAWTLTIKCEYLPPKKLAGVAPDAPVSAFLALAKKELDLPNALPLSRLTLRSRSCFHDVDVATALRASNLSDGGEVTLSVKRPHELPLEALPLVVHLSSRRSREEVRALATPNPTPEQLMKTPHHTFIVRGDVHSSHLLRHLNAKGKLGLSRDLKISEFGLWWNWTYKGDNFYIGRLLEDDQPMKDAGGSGVRERLLLEACKKPKADIEQQKRARRQRHHGASEPRPPRARPAPLTRLEVLKHLFEAFVNRVDAEDFALHLGLVLFSSTVKEELPLTNLIESFREKAEDVVAHGDTKLFDAIEQGAGMLRAFKEKHQDKEGGDSPRLRLLVLSDGADTGSRASSVDVAALCQTEGITVDAVLIGGTDNKDLWGIAKASGGYVFQPQRLQDALRLFELETMSCSVARPAYTGPPRLKVTERRVLREYGCQPPDVCNDLKVPPARQHPRLAEPVRTLEAALAEVAAKQLQEEQEREEAAAGGGGGGMSREGIRRLQRELTALARPDGGHPAFTLFPSGNLSFIRLLLQGPEGSLYAGGVWLLYMSFPDTYPLEAPKVRFVTPIKYANVNPHGRICLSILDRNYTVETSLHNVLASIFGLLLQPETSDPVDTTLSQLFYKADGSYEATILAHVRTHAVDKSLSQWKAELARGGGSGAGGGVDGQEGREVEASDEPGFTLGAPSERRASARLKGKRPNSG